MKTGDRVHTKMDTFPVSTGTVEHISSCGRYVRVRKRYGAKKSWVKAYYVSELDIIKDKQGV